MDISDWTTCEMYGHRFLNTEGEAPKPGECGHCADCDEDNGECDD
jgi:hypothetical protein